jgi:hypothetical protein
LVHSEIMSFRPLVAVVVVGLFLAGCGSGGSKKVATGTSTTTTTAASASSGRAAFQAYTACLRQHRVNLPHRQAGTSAPPTTGANGQAGGPPPGSGAGGGFFGDGQPPAGVDQATWQAAMKACASKRPTGSFGGRGLKAFQAYLSCLKDHGVTVPSGTDMRSLNRSDPTFIAANKTCAPLLPARPNGTTTTTVAAS